MLEEVLLMKNKSVLNQSLLLGIKSLY